jgi:hypothetical protein
MRSSQTQRGTNLSNGTSKDRDNEQVSALFAAPDLAKRPLACAGYTCAGCTTPAVIFSYF